jgi:hypothetical protein
MIFFDTETCGFHGPTVLIQYGEGRDGPITLHSVWTSPIVETMELIEWLCENTVVAFNLAFDWFHICQTYTTLQLLGEDLGWDVIPNDHIELYAKYEEQARHMDVCLKPKGALDLMLHARKGPYQSTMNRGGITIKRIPTLLANPLVEELNSRLPLKDIYFARKKDASQRWQVMDILDDFDEVVPEFKDVKLTFAPSSALKVLAQDALNLPPDNMLLFGDIDLPASARPEELGYAPFAMAHAEVHDGWIDWNGAWPAKIYKHISHWAYNKLARQYAEKDVEYLRRLHYEVFNEPEPNDDDSILAAMVGAVRWKGFKIDVPAFKKEVKRCEAILEKMPFNHQSTDLCKRYLFQALSDQERIAMRDPSTDKYSTKGIILEELAKWRLSVICPKCDGLECEECDDGLLKGEDPHPVAPRAALILEARHASKRIQVCEKLLLAGKFHASFKVIGTLSTRMSGADGMNAQGMQSDFDFRRMFTLAEAEEDEELNGGDFKSFEVSLADAAYDDPVLRQKLQQMLPCPDCSGTGMDGDEECRDCKDYEGVGMAPAKIHAIFGTYLFPGMSYDDILATKGLKPKFRDLYGRAKACVFAILYGGESYTLINRGGIDEETAIECYDRWCAEHEVWSAERAKIFDMFCSMRQPGGIGTNVEWHDPHDYIESMFGFRRYFTLENRIVKCLFDLASDPPKEWAELPIKVVRRERVQYASGAVRSALYAASFAIQASNMRAAGNHVIQSAGAQATKALQCEIWLIQPHGIHEWEVRPFNVHDEVMAVTKKRNSKRVADTAYSFTNRLKEKVPLAGIDWSTGMKSWAEK